jgi:dTDP-4-dehydrorhamnose reductase
MKVWLTGGTGFVGSNVVHEAVQAGHEVLTTVNRFVPEGPVGYETDRVDMTDADAVNASVRAFDPEVVIHCAILNDFERIYADRRAAWDSYVGATRHCAAAAETVGASFIVVSTDWVFDGSQGGADEDTPPNPVNLYGVLKVASELVALERGGAVARISGVNGVHRARPDSPRDQDRGFGYFVASIVDSLGQDKSFTVWESDGINMIATPSLASQCGELMLRIGERRLDGVFHCCGADAVGRMELAELTCEVFRLDPSLLRSGPPGTRTMRDVPIPYDTSIIAPRTAQLLDHQPTPVRELLERFRAEYEAVA